MRRFLIPLALLLVCAGVCGGFDEHARSVARESRSVAPIEAPGAPEPPGVAPVAPPPGEAASLLGAATQLYGSCREDGIWSFRLAQAFERRELERTDLSPERRARIERTNGMIDGMLDTRTTSGKLFAICGFLGPSTPPPEFDLLSKLPPAR